MEIILDIPDKMYNEIMEMCVYNDIVLDDYLLDCILDNFNLMKYDDLNEKLNKKEEKIETPKVEEKPKEVTEKKKVGRPRKKKEEEIKQEEVVKQIETPRIEEKKEIEQPKITKRTRVLKTR
jgi:hypothetical protein